jgi:hypothetical protein
VEGYEGVAALSEGAPPQTPQVARGAPLKPALVAWEGGDIVVIFSSFPPPSRVLRNRRKKRYPNSTRRRWGGSKSAVVESKSAVYFYLRSIFTADPNSIPPLGVEPPSSLYNVVPPLGGGTPRVSAVWGRNPTRSGEWQESQVIWI